jgi:hypothetical protein
MSISIHQQIICVVSVIPHQHIPHISIIIKLNCIIPLFNIKFEPNECNNCIKSKFIIKIKNKLFQDLRR